MKVVDHAIVEGLAYFRKKSRSGDVLEFMTHAPGLIPFSRGHRLVYNLSLLESAWLLIWITLTLYQAARSIRPLCYSIRISSASDPRVRNGLSIRNSRCWEFRQICFFQTLTIEAFPSNHSRCATQKLGRTLIRVTQGAQPRRPITNSCPLHSARIGSCVLAVVLPK